MSDPASDTDLHKPADDIPGRQEARRAEPLQPDKPASGSDADEADDAADTAAAERQKAQSDTALKNVRKGYD